MWLVNRCIRIFTVILGKFLNELNGMDSQLIFSEQDVATTHSLKSVGKLLESNEGSRYLVTNGSVSWLSHSLDFSCSVKVLCMFRRHSVKNADYW